MITGIDYINYDTGIKPEIAEDVVINGLVDCIHKVTIEKSVFSGHDIMLITGGHDPNKFGQERKGSNGGGPITIHEGVWIGTRAIIVGAVTIGKHAVIGAGAVVVKDVPEYSLVVGNPAKVVKYYEH